VSGNNEVFMYLQQPLNNVNIAFPDYENLIEIGELLQALDGGRITREQFLFAIQGNGASTESDIGKVIQAYHLRNTGGAGNNQS
jgi:hypothetical protein